MSPATRSSTPPPATSSSTGDKAATDVVAVLRVTVGRDPYDKPLSDLVGELSTRSDEFRASWAATPATPAFGS
jgi:hypothetical protein